MKKPILIIATALLSVVLTSAQENSVEKNIKMYSNTWEHIINKGDLSYFNQDNFDPNITLLMGPENIVGIEDVKTHYNQYITGFSDVVFTVKDIFGQGNKLVKHWNFTGKHTGDFFGIPATGESVNVEGVTLVVMKNGKIAQEQDFMDSAVFMQQLGLTSNPENVGIIDSAYKAFAEGNVPMVLSLLDPKVEWSEAEGNAYADGNPYIGPDAVLNGVFMRLGAEWEYFKLKDIVLHDMSNDQVLATLRYDAKYKKNGEAIDAQVAHLWKLKDGKIVSFQQYVDTKQLADAISK